MPRLAAILHSPVGSQWRRHTRTHPSVGRCQGPPTQPYHQPVSSWVCCSSPPPLLRGSESAVLLSLSLPLSPRQAELDTLGPPPEAHRSDPPKALYTLYVPAIPAEELRSSPPARSSPHPHVARHFLTSTTTLARTTKLETPLRKPPSQLW